MTRHHLSPTPNASEKHSAAGRRSVGGTKSFPPASAGKRYPRHSVRDYMIVLSGIGVLTLLKTTLPKLDLKASAAGKQTAPVRTRKAHPSSSGGRAASVSWTDVLKQLYGTTEPTRAMIEQNMAFLADINRGEGVYVAVYKEGRPDEIFFAGYSCD